MKHFFVLFFLFFTLLHGGEECTDKRFSLNAYQSRGSELSLLDLVRDVAKTCHISVVFEDRRTKERLSQPLDMVNIKDFTLPQLFAFIFDDHNLFYTYNENEKVLRVAYTKTVNFNIDYINISQLTTTSSKSITVGPGTTMGTGTGTSGGYGMTGTTGMTGGTTGIGMSGGMGMMGSGSNTDYTNVRATSTFTFWDQLKDHIEQIMQIEDGDNGQIGKTIVNRDAAVVSVTGTKRQIESVKRYLDKLEQRMHAQVMIEAYLIELTYNDYNTTGVNWSDLSLSLSGNYANSYNNMGIPHPVYSFGVNFNPMGLIDFLNRYGNVEVLSNPKVLTLNNQPAVINVGKQLSYLYSSGSIGTTSAGIPTSATTNTLGSVFVGLTLNIIPELTDDGYILMRINPVSSELIGEDTNASSFMGSNEVNANRTMPPDTRVKQMTSIVKVKDAQKVLIGGLIEKKNFTVDNKVPVLGDIPLIGRLFHGSKLSTRKSELFILITPKLIRQDVFPTIDDAIMKRFD